MVGVGEGAPIALQKPEMGVSSVTATTLLLVATIANSFANEVHPLVDPSIQLFESHNVMCGCEVFRLCVMLKAAEEVNVPVAQDAPPPGDPPEQALNPLGMPEVIEVQYVPSGRDEVSTLPGTPPVVITNPVPGGAGPGMP